MSGLSEEMKVPQTFHEAAHQMLGYDADLGREGCEICDRERERLRRELEDD